MKLLLAAGFAVGGALLAVARWLLRTLDEVDVVVDERTSY